MMSRMYCGEGRLGGKRKRAETATIATDPDRLSATNEVKAGKEDAV